MIKIKKGDMILTVTEAAYNDYYKPFGWKKEAAQKKVSREHETESNSEYMDEEDLELMSKPASEMTTRELKRYAKLAGLGGDYGSKAELLDAVVEHQKHN